MELNKEQLKVINRLYKPRAESMINYLKETTLTDEQINKAVELMEKDLRREVRGALQEAKGQIVVRVKIPYKFNNTLKEIAKRKSTTVNALMLTVLYDYAEHHEVKK